MRKTYINPSTCVIALTPDSVILAASGNSFSVGMSDEQANGEDAFSARKDIWENENVW